MYFSLFSQLVVDTGYALSKTKIADNAAADFYKYGLDDASLSARYTVTTLSGRLSISVSRHELAIAVL